MALNNHSIDCIVNATETEAEKKCNEKNKEIADRARKEDIMLRFACALVVREGYDYEELMTVLDNASDLAESFMVYVDNNYDV